MTRSPNYPAISIEEAVSDAKNLWKQIQRTAVTPEELAKHLGYKGLTGTSRPRIAALKKYGIVHKKGKGLALTDRAVNIAVREQGSSEYESAIKEAILDVPLFADLMKEYQDSSPTMVEQHLIIDRSFTKDGASRAADAFIAAKNLLSQQADGTVLPEDYDDDSDQDSPIKVGSLVHWISQDQQMWTDPRKVTRIDVHDGEKFLCVPGEDGVEGWIPMSQAEMVDALSPPPGGLIASMTGGLKKPPPPPSLDHLKPSEGMEESRWKLPSGNAIVILPSTMTERDFKVLRGQIDLLEMSSFDYDTDED